MIRSGQQESLLSRRELADSAWHVLRHRRAAGFDGVAPHDLDQAQADRLVREVHRIVNHGEVRWSGARVGRAPRPPKPPRVHAITTLRDGIVLRAAVNKIGAARWPHISPIVVGGRPGGSVRAIVHDLSSLLVDGCWVLRWDIENAFSSAPFSIAFDDMVSHDVDPRLGELVTGWHRRQGRRFGGLIEGSPAGPLMLAALLDARLVPYLKNHVDKTRVWLDDGITVCDSEDEANTVRMLVQSALSALGMTLNATKTGVHRHDGSALSSWNFLGLRWRGNAPQVDPTTVEHVLGECRHVVDTVDDPLRALEKVRRRLEPWLGYYRTVLDDSVLEALRQQLVAGIGYVYEPTSSVGTAGSRGTLSPRAGSGYQIAAQAGHGQKPGMNRRRGRDVPRGSHPGHDHAPSGETSHSHECGLAVSTTYNAIVDEIVGDVGRRTRSLLALARSHPVLRQGDIAATMERLLGEHDHLRRQLVRLRWNRDLELIPEIDFMVIAGRPEELGFVRKQIERTRKLTHRTMAGSNLQLMILAYAAMDLDTVIVPTCTACGELVRPTKFLKFWTPKKKRRSSEEGA